MNKIKHITITIDFDVWEPFNKYIEDELDNILDRIKTRELLQHAGNVKTTFMEKIDNE